MITEGPSPVNDSADILRNRLDNRGRLELQEHLEILKRRRWILVVCSVLAVTAMWRVQRQWVDQYTGEVLLQQATLVSPLESQFGGVVEMGWSADALATQIAILRSRTVLGAVVESMGLRLTVDSRRMRSRILTAVEIAPDARRGSYLLGLQGNEFVLRESETETVRGRAAAGDWLEGPGFRIRPGAATEFTEPVALTVVTAENAVIRLRNALRVAPVRPTRLLSAKFTDSDPVTTSQVANAVALSFQAYGQGRLQQRATDRLRVIENELIKASDSLIAAQKAVVAFQERSRVANVKAERELITPEILAADNQLQMLRFDEGVLADLLRDLRSGGSGEQVFQRIAAIGAALLPAGDVELARLRALEDERGRLTEARYGLTDGGPGVAAVDSLIAAAKRDILAMSEEALRLHVGRREATEARLRDLQVRLLDLGEPVAAQTALEQRLFVTQNSFNLLFGRYHEALVTEAVETGDVEIIETAIVPSVADPSHKRRNLALALLVGLVLGVGVVFVLEHLDSSVRHVEDAERAGGAQVLGLIRELPSASNGQNPIVLRGDQPGSESFRMLRTSLHFARDNSPRVLAISSAALGEGKTTVASNLSYALAQQGNRVLLVDADMREPTVHKVFKLPRVPGLSDLLVGDLPPADAVQSLGEPPLSVLCSGTNVTTPAELLGGSAFNGLLNYAREKFDYVIIDTPPVLAATDGTVIGTLVDGFIVVVRSNRTDRLALTRTTDLLRQVDVPLLGFVLNRVPVGPAYNQYGYYAYVTDAYAAGGSAKRRANRMKVVRFLRRMVNGKDQDEQTTPVAPHHDNDRKPPLDR